MSKNARVEELVGAYSELHTHTHTPREKRGQTLPLPSPGSVDDGQQTLPLVHTIALEA